MELVSDVVFYSYETNYYVDLVNSPEYLCIKETQILKDIESVIETKCPEYKPLSFSLVNTISFTLEHYVFVV